MIAKKPIREGLTAAACTLLGVGAPAAARAVDFDASLLHYTEGSRVTVNESVMKLRRPFAGDRVFGFGVTVDVMTGASGNGAVVSTKPQTFTRASGRGVYVVLPGEAPLDDTFQDNRVALDASLETPLGRTSRGVFGGSFSIEYDYLSAGASATLTRDFDRRNTTLAVGGALSYDVLSPEGGVPVPFAAMRPPGQAPARSGGTDDKWVADVVLGLTQVVDRSTLARVNYSYSRSTGYQTDPFKMLSVLDADGDPTEYLYERRPSRRVRQSVYAAVKRYVGGDVAEASYRFMHDDWGIGSHTFEARYRWRGWVRRYLEPQWRFYRQSASDFYAPFLADGGRLPDYASADYRLDSFDAHTFALKYGVVINDVHEVGIRIGYYVQLGDRSPPDSMTSLRGRNLFPDISAYILQVTYSAR